MSDRGTGIVYLVGAGPGDPGLLTLRGASCLAKADVVVVDYLADQSLLAHAPPAAEKIYVGKSASCHTMEQDGINALLVKNGQEGKVVVRLKGGDPFVFGRGAEECEALRAAGIPFEVVPGVTAGIAAAACAGIPVTSRGFASSVAFVTGSEDPGKAGSSIRWEHLAKGVDTLVFYMGVGNLAAIVQELMRHGRAGATPVAIIRWGTKPMQRTVTGTLDTIAGIAGRADIRPPSIIIVGEVVTFRDRLQWFESRPLYGRRIVNTRARVQASRLTGPLRELGAEVLELPTIETVPAGKESALAAAIANIDDFHWILFTSANGVHAFIDLLCAVKGDIRAIGRARIAAIGPGTAAAIQGYRLWVDCIAGEATAEGLIGSLGAYDWKNIPVLLPHAEMARDTLPRGLRALGADLTVVTAYTTTPPVNADRSILDDIVSGRYDLITFSASSTFENFAGMFGAEEFAGIAPTLKAASIGPVTTDALARAGVTPLVEASEHTIPGLIECIREYLAP